MRHPRRTRDRLHRQELFARDEWVCHICSEAIDSALCHPDPRSASVDHVIPLARGGDDTDSNCAAAHLVCNLNKRALTAIGSPLVRRAKVESPSASPPSGMPLRAGQVVALGLPSGCPVGMIETVDEQWISIVYFRWLTGLFHGDRAAFRLNEVEQIQWADWYKDWEGDVAFRMDELSDFQTRWIARLHEAQELGQATG